MYLAVLWIKDRVFDADYYFSFRISLKDDFFFKIQS